MPTADRTTIRAALEELATKLRTNLSADPPTAAKPFRRVAVGPGDPASHPRPFLAVRVVRTRLATTVNDDKAIEVTVALRVVTDVTTADPNGAVLDQAGAVEDYLDSIRETGILLGAEGFDDRAWSFETPKATSAARVVAAEATQTLIVKVQRTFNRATAP